MVRGQKFLLWAALCLVTAPAAFAAEPEVNPGETLLHIETIGEATAAPDYGQMSIGVVSTGATAREATDANAATMAAVTTAIVKAGVEASFIRTEQINLQPRLARADQNDYEGQARITGYVARNSVIVTLNKLTIAPDVIAAAFGAGANSANGPSLQIRQTVAIRNAARRDAIANAKLQAQTYADSLGMKIQRILRVSEDSGNGRSDIVEMSYRVSNASVPAVPAPISPGQLRITVSVRVDYALAPK